ncbi:permease [Demequina subtropica]|uniref:permease n=1 Tax=Demequina subtropica TaxID=1638989 RepID=UPI000782684B|nr:permease [Demequina subtropica]
MSPSPDQACCPPPAPPAALAATPSPSTPTGTCCSTAPAPASSCCDDDAGQDEPSDPRRLRAAVAAGALGAILLISAAGPAWTRVLTALGVDLDSALGTAVHFALYESGKILALIALIVFAVGFLGTWLTPARVQRMLAGRRRGAGHAVAAGLGAVTPFCSCSSVPLYVGLTRAGVPAGVGMTFLVASPLVNEIALALLASMLGIGIAVAYLVLGLAIAIGAGVLVGATRGRETAPVRTMLPLATAERRPSFDDRLRAGVTETRTTLRKLWPFVLLAIGLGAAVHGWVPTDVVAEIGGHWWGVPAAVLIGIPLYSATATAVPLVAPLAAAGVPIGTLIAMIMAVAGLSAPELLMLRKVMDRRTLAMFVAVVALGIVAAGYLLNAVT